PGPGRRFPWDDTSCQRTAAYQCPCRDRAYPEGSAPSGPGASPRCSWRRPGGTPGRPPGRRARFPAPAVAAPATGWRRGGRAGGPCEAADTPAQTTIDPVPGPAETPWPREYAPDGAG